MATMRWKSGRFELLRRLQQFNDNTRSVEVHCDAFPFFCDWVGIEPFPSLREVGGCLQGVDEAQGWPSFVVALNDENRVVDVISSRGEEKYLYVRSDSSGDHHTDANGNAAALTETPNKHARFKHHRVRYEFTDCLKRLSDFCEVSLLKIVTWCRLKERGIIDFSISIGNQRFHTSNNMHIFSIKS